MDMLKAIPLRLIALILIFVNFHAAHILAQEPSPIVVTIGQDQTFLKFNYYKHYFEDDGNHLLWPDERRASAHDNVAYVSLSATPIHAAAAQAAVGIAFEWNLGKYTWEQIENWPVRITYKFYYDISAFYVDETGGSGALVSFAGNNNSIYDVVGYPTGNDATKKYVTEVVDTAPGNDGHQLTVGDLELWGRLLYVNVLCQACSNNPYQGATNYSSAKVVLQSIKIEFINALIDSTRAYQSDNMTVDLHNLIVNKAKSIKTLLKETCPIHYFASYHEAYPNISAFKTSIKNHKPEVMLVHSHGGCTTYNDNVTCIPNTSSYMCFQDYKCMYDNDVSALNFKVGGGIFFAASCNSAASDNLGLAFIAHGYQAFIGYKNTVKTKRNAVFYKMFFNKAINPGVSIYEALASTIAWAKDQEPPWCDVASARIISNSDGRDIYLGGKPSSVPADEEFVDSDIEKISDELTEIDETEYYINEEKVISIANDINEVKNIKKKNGSNIAVRIEKFRGYCRVVFYDKRNGISIYGVDIDNVTYEIVSHGELG